MYKLLKYALFTQFLLMVWGFDVLAKKPDHDQPQELSGEIFTESMEPISVSIEKDDVSGKISHEETFKFDGDNVGTLFNHSRLDGFAVSDAKTPKSVLIEECISSPLVSKSYDFKYGKTTEQQSGPKGRQIFRLDVDQAHWEDGVKISLQGGERNTTLANFRFPMGFYVPVDLICLGICKSFYEHHGMLIKAQSGASGSSQPRKLYDIFKNAATKSKSANKSNNRKAPRSSGVSCTIEDFQQLCVYLNRYLQNPDDSLAEWLMSLPIVALLMQLYMPAGDSDELEDDETQSILNQLLRRRVVVYG